MYVYRFDCDFETKQEFNWFLCSDPHIDDPHHDKELFKKDLDEAVKRNARILINGDVVSGILKSDKKRYSKSSDKYELDNSLNMIVDDAYHTLYPYRDYIDLIGVGNHEVSIMRYHDFDIIAMLIKMLNSVRDTNLQPIQHGGYQGFIALNFRYKKGKWSTRFVIFYNHGQGGAAPVTKGVIDLARRQSVDSDCVWLGHKHQFTLQKIDPILCLDKNFNMLVKTRYGLITGCYVKPIHDYNPNNGYRIDYGEEKMRGLVAQRGVFLKIIAKNQQLEHYFEVS